MKWKYIPFLLMYFISLVMVAFVDLVTAQFSPQHLLSSTYWSNITTVAIANLLVLLSSAFFDVDKIKETDIRVLKRETEIRNFIMADMKTDFYDFIDYDNTKRKIKQWKIYIDQKIINLQHKKTSKKQIEKLRQLDEMLTDEYISRHIAAIKIKYYQIKISEIISGYRYSDEEDRLESGFGKVAKDIMPKFLLSTSLPIFISSFAMDVKKVTPVLIITISSKVISLIMNFMNGKQYARTYINEKVLYNLDYRMKFIERYLAWRIEKKGDNIETNCA